MEYIKQTDIEIINFFYENHNPFLDKIAVIITMMTKGAAIWLAVSLALIILNKGNRNTGVMSMASLVSGYIAAQLILKPLIERARPFVELDGIELLISEPSSYSMPSTHSVLAFAFVGSVIRSIKSRWAKMALVLFGSAVALFRVYLSVHYLSDVVIGSILGILISQIIYYFSRKYDRIFAEGSDIYSEF